MAKVNKSDRRRQDYLRRRALKVGKVYEGKLVRARAKEFKRVLGICKDTRDLESWGDIFKGEFEEPYLEGWFKGLTLGIGMPQARSVAEQLTRKKALTPDGVWERALIDYAENRAGESITSISDTIIDFFVDKLQDLLLERGEGFGVESLALALTEEYEEVALWMCRRIAQTESMMALGESSFLSAESLAIPYKKQWTCSGLNNTRETHRYMDGVIVDRDAKFILPDCTMRFPCDASSNAPAEEIINCACSCLYIPI